jgi:hypothetical protein
LKEFKIRNIPYSKNITISKQKTGVWLIKDKEFSYFIKRINNELNIYKTEYMESKNEIFKLFYRKNYFFRIVFDSSNRGMAVGLFLLVISLLALNLITFGSHGLLFNKTVNGITYVGFFESTTFWLIIVLIPIGFLVMKYIYEKYWDAFNFDLKYLIDFNKKVKLNGKWVNITEKDYREFLYNSHYSLQSPTQKWVWFFTALIVIGINIVYWFTPAKNSFFGAEFLSINARLTIYFSYVITWLILTNIIVTFSWQTIAIVRSMRRFCLFPLKLRPLDPDKAAGLSSLSSLAFSMDTFCAIAIIGIAIAMYALKEPFHLLIIFGDFLISIMVLLLFILPLSKAHNVMKRTKENLLSNLINEHHKTFDELNELLSSKKSKKKKLKKTKNKQFIILQDKLKRIDEVYDRTLKMPIWPFDFNFTVRILSLVFLPISISILQFFIFKYVLI